MSIIEFPERPSEAEIERLLCSALEKKGFTPRQQVKTRLNGRLCKLDIVVFREKIPLCIIECKAWTKRYSKLRWYQLAKNTKQIHKYETLGFPVYVCGRLETITKLADFIAQKHP